MKSAQDLMQKIRDTKTLDVNQKVESLWKIRDFLVDIQSFRIADFLHQILGRFHSNLLKGIEH